MIAKAAVFLIGVAFGAGAALFVTTLDSLAPRYSQAIYDCGIRISANASGGEIKGFVVSGGRYGICVDTQGATSISDFVTK